jgi:hypothetical protein
MLDLITSILSITAAFLCLAVSINMWRYSRRLDALVARAMRARDAGCKTATEFYANLDKYQ